MATARLFWSGHSQAVRLPKEFRLEGDEVRITRSGNRLIIEPIEHADWLDMMGGPAADELDKILEENRLRSHAKPRRKVELE